MSILLFFQNFGPANITLFIRGSAPINNNTTLFIDGSQPISFNTTLFTKGVFKYLRGMNLFVKANIVPNINNIVNMTINGNKLGFNGQYSYSNLFINGEATHKQLNLFINGISTGKSKNNLNIFIAGNNVLAGKEMDLFIKNNISNINNNITLFISGDGISDGAIPYNKSMNLFIRRNPTNFITLFISVASPINSQTNLFIAGANTIVNSTPLTMPYTKAAQDFSLVLYTHGF